MAGVGGVWGIVALAAWIGITYLVARYVGLPGAMVAFFMPAVALALWFMFVSARGSGRDPEMDSAIDREAGGVIGRHADFAEDAETTGQRRNLTPGPFPTREGENGDGR